MPHAHPRLSRPRTIGLLALATCLIVPLTGARTTDTSHVSSPAAVQPSASSTITAPNAAIAAGLEHATLSVSALETFAQTSSTEGFVGAVGQAGAAAVLLKDGNAKERELAQNMDAIATDLGGRLLNNVRSNGTLSPDEARGLVTYCAIIRSEIQHLRTQRKSGSP